MRWPLKKMPKYAIALSAAAVTATAFLHIKNGPLQPVEWEVLYWVLVCTCIYEFTILWLCLMKTGRRPRNGYAVLLVTSVIGLCQLPGGHETLAPFIMAMSIFALLSNYNDKKALFFCVLLTIGVMYRTPSYMIVALICILILAKICELILSNYTSEIEVFDRARTSAANLADAYVRLQNVAADMEEISAGEERRRIAREFHDTLGHSLTAALMQMQACAELIELEPDNAKEKFNLARDMVEKSFNEVKSAVSVLRLQLPNRPVGRVLWLRLGATFAQCTDTAVQMHIQEEFTDVDSELDETVYRVIQEGLTNAYRHGHATIVDVVVHWRPNILKIRISDNGSGLEVLHEGYGLKGMRERVGIFGGNIEWRSEVGRGFDLGVDIPWEREISNGTD